MAKNRDVLRQLKDMPVPAPRDAARYTEAMLTPPPQIVPRRKPTRQPPVSGEGRKPGRKPRLIGPPVQVRGRRK